MFPVQSTYIYCHLLCMCVGGGEGGWINQCQQDFKQKQFLFELLLLYSNLILLLNLLIKLTNEYYYNHSHKLHEWITTLKLINFTDY